MKLHKTKEREIYYYYLKDGEKAYMYRHKYNDDTGERREKKKSGFETETAALKALLKVKAATLQGETKLIKNDNITVAQWLDRWYEMNEKGWEVTTRDQREMVIRTQMKPLLGKYKLQALDRATYQREYINVLEKKFKTSTVKLFHTLFKIAINAAVEEELLKRNRIKKVVIGGIEEDEAQPTKSFLTPSELNTLLETAKKYENITNYTFLLTIAYTGMRRGEACGLQWRDIDFEGNRITIERTRDVKGVRSPKTKNSYRVILVDDMVISQLKKYQTWCKQAFLSFGIRYTDESFIFISYQTFILLPDTSIFYMFKRVMIKSGLVTNEGKAKITIHGLRHTHATILLNKGQNVKAIAKRLGNTVKMIYEIYGHVLEELERESVDVFSESLKSIGANSGANQ